MIRATARRWALHYVGVDSGALQPLCYARGSRAATVPSTGATGRPVSPHPQLIIPHRDVMRCACVTCDVTTRPSAVGGGGFKNRQMSPQVVGHLMHVLEGVCGLDSMTPTLRKSVDALFVETEISADVRKARANVAVAALVSTVMHLP